MFRGSIHTADLSVRHREVLHLASLDPDTTAFLSRYVRVETLVGVVAGVAIAGAGGIMAAAQSSSSWWGLVPVAVGVALSGGAWVRSRHWVTKVKRSLVSPGQASTWSARFGRVPLRHYPHLLGSAYAYLAPSTPVRGAPRVPLIEGQSVPIRQQLSPVIVIAGSRSGWSPTAIIVEERLLFASPTPAAARLRRRFRRQGRGNPGSGGG
jgi:hypothetical protein